MLRSLMAAGALVLWGGSPGDARAETKIGAPFALSGSIADLAAEMRKGAELAAAHVNEQGGVLGGPFRLVFADSACDADLAVEVVTDLIEKDGVAALIGPTCSSATLRQARSVSIPAGVVTLSVASASPLITLLRDDDLVFRTAVSDTFKGRAMAKYAYENGIEDVAVSFANDAYNTGLADVFTDAFVELGGTVAVNQAHQPDRPDYIREVEALASGSEHVALFAYYGSSGSEFLKNILASDAFDTIIGTDGLLSDDIIEILGEDGAKKTVIIASSSNEDRAGFKAWSAFADPAGIKASGPFVPNSYDAVFMMALAIEAAGSAERSAISSGLRAISGPEGETIYPGEFEKARTLLSEGTVINYQGASGPVDFDQFGDITGFVSANKAVDGAWIPELVR